VHPHMLRHACGYPLANDGVDTRSLQAYLGHRNIHTRSAIPNCVDKASKDIPTNKCDGYGGCCRGAIL
jgi:integrase